MKVEPSQIAYFWWDGNEDTNAPVVTLNGESPMEISEGGSYVEPGAVSDSGEEVTVTGTVNPDVPGTYTLTYTAVDEAGNVGTATREVIVTDSNFKNYRKFTFTAFQIILRLN